MRVAITYHYSLAFGGSERVLEVLADMYPEADFFCLMVDERFLPERLKGRTIHRSFLDRIPFAKRFHRHLLPVYPLAVESLDLGGYDLVISADGAATKGVITDQDSVHICYCHSPARSYWDQYANYRREMPLLQRAMFTGVSHYLRMWDSIAAQRIDGFIANSAYVADRIFKYYKRESTVIHPPIDTSGSYVSYDHDDYYLSTGRLVPAKRVDLLIAACNNLGRKLKIVGTGPEEQALRTVAGPHIEFIGRVPDDELKKLYARCRAFLFAADEDFGIVPLEAQAFGRPVVAYGKGGSLETVVPLGERQKADRPPTGLFFPHQTVDAVEEGLHAFEMTEFMFDPEQIRKHARKFDTEVFISRVRQYVDAQIERKRHGLSSGEGIEKCALAGYAEK